MDGQKPARKLRPLRPIELEPGVAAAATAHRRRLEELKRQVADGTYEVDPRRVAREIMRQGLDPD